MTIFGSLEMGRTALMAQYKGVQVTGQNIANANTPGYTRQRVEMEAIVPAITINNNLTPGRGVLVKDVVRINSEFFHKQVVENNGFKGKWDTLLTAFRNVENIFMEPDEVGLNAYIEEFFDTWHDLAAAPESIAVRMALREMTYSLTSVFQDNYRRLSELREDYEKELNIAVADVNSLLNQAAQINEKLMLINASTEKSNELEDQMDQIIKELGEYIDFRFYKQANGAVDMYSNGRLLVGNQYAYPIYVELDVERDSYPEGVREVVFKVTKEGEDEFLPLTGNAQNGYQLVVNGNRDTTYNLGIHKLEYNNEAADKMEVFVSRFNDDKGVDKYDELKEYYMERLGFNDDVFRAMEKSYQHDGHEVLANLEKVLNGKSALFTVENGHIVWAEVVGLDADGKMAAEATSLSVRGDFPIGNFTLKGNISGGDVDIRNMFDLQIRDTVDSTVVNTGYRITNHNGIGLNFAQGRVVGLLETINDVIISAQDGVNDIVSRLVFEVNNIHREAYGLDFGEAGAGDFFYEIKNNGIAPVLQFGMVKELFDDPLKIGTASENSEPGNAEQALLIAQMRQDRLMSGGTATISEYYRAMTTSLATKGKETQQMVNLYERVGMKLQEEHDAITGVNLDEEMINLIQFQNAWQAAAKFISYIDEMLAILINLGHR